MTKIPSITDVLVDEAMTRQQRGQVRTARDISGMLTTSQALQAEMVLAGRGISEDTMRYYGEQAAKNYFEHLNPGVRPDRDAFNKKAEEEFNRIKYSIESRAKEEKKRGEEAIRKGALTDLYDVTLTPQQEENREAGTAWFRTTEQMKHAYLRNGMVPKEFVTDFLAADSSKIALSIPEKEGGVTGLPDKLRKLFEDDLAAPQFGAPSKEDVRTNVGYGQKFVDMIFGAVGAAGEAFSSGRAEAARAMREGGNLKQLMYEAPAPSVEELRRIDLKLYPKEGGAPWEYEAKTPAKTIEEQKEAMKGPPIQRALGAPVDEFNAFTMHKDQSLLGQWVDGLKGFFYTNDRASWEKELSYLKEGYSVAAQRNVEAIRENPSDPRYSRYYLPEKERSAKAEEKAREALLERNRQVHETTQDEWWGSMDWFTRASALTGLPVSKGAPPDYQKPPLTLSSQDLDPNEVREVATQVYEHLPALLMAQDMLRLDGWDMAIRNPKVYEMMHKMVLDPINVGNPYKHVWTATKWVGREGTALAAKTGEAVLGAERAERYARPIKAAEQGLDRMFAHWTKREKTFQNFDDRMEAAEALAKAADDLPDIAGSQLVGGEHELARQLGDARGGVTKAEEKLASAEEAFRLAPMEERALGPGDVRGRLRFEVEEAHKALDEAVAKADTLQSFRSDLVKAAARGAESRGVGGAYALQTHANQILGELRKAKTIEEKEALFKVLQGDVKLTDMSDPNVMQLYRQRVLEDEHRVAMRAWRRKGKKGDAPVMPEAVVTAEESAELFAKIAVKNGDLPRHLADVPLAVRKHSDKFEALARKFGQFNRIEGGILRQARYVNHFVPRYLQYTERLHDSVVKAGYLDIAEAAGALNPHTLKETIEGLREMNFVGTSEEILSKAAGNIDALRALPPTTPGGRTLDLDAVVDAHYARQKIDPGDWEDIENIRKAMLDVDMIGSNALHRVSPVTRSAKERKKVGELYPWIKDPYAQYEAYTREVINKARGTAEMQEMVRAFGLNGTIGALGGPAMFIVSKKGLGKSRGKGASKVSAEERRRNVAVSLSNRKGIEMVALDRRLSQKFAQVILPVGTKIGPDAVVFAPKAFGNRINSLLPIVGGTPSDFHIVMNGLAEAHRWTLAPLNTIWRMKSTVLRSPAFHALNYYGAVGLGFLAHGLKAFDPKLQKGAHHAAFVAGMNGSEKAKATKFLLQPDEFGKRYEWSIGEAVEFAEEWGLIHQGTARHGLDIAAGRGIGKSIAGLQKKFAGSKLSGAGITSAQAIANYADDYQKFIALLGRIKNPTDMRDVYNTLDFVGEYAGNMNRMTQFEKTIMRNGQLFYSWNRFILPHLVKQVVKNPARLAGFEKIRSVIEQSTRENAPFTGAGVPGYLWMQGAFVAPEAMQPGEGGFFSHEHTMAIIETPLASLSVLAGGFYGESPVHAQLGPMGWALINMLTGFDNTTGHPWQKELTMPDFSQIDNMQALKQWLFSAHDSKVGRELMEIAPFGGPIMNLIKLYGNNGMYNEQAELWMRLRAGRDFFGLDNLVAGAVGAKGLSIPGQVEINGVMVPLPFVRGYAVRPITTARRQQRRALEAFQGI